MNDRSRWYRKDIFLLNLFLSIEGASARTDASLFGERSMGGRLPAFAASGRRLITTDQPDNLLPCEPRFVTRGHVSN